VYKMKYKLGVIASLVVRLIGLFLVFTSPKIVHYVRHLEVRDELAGVATSTDDPNTHPIVDKGNQSRP